MILQGVGVDVVDVPRFTRLVDRWGPSFTGRWFTDRERSECADAGDPTHRFPARFALKEAVWKALRVGTRDAAVPWRDIAVLRAGTSWSVELTGAVGRAAAEASITCIRCSVSATDALAIATAVAHRVPVGDG